VRDSISEMAEIVLPNDANPLNALLGGRLMHWIDLAGAMAAHRHSRAYVVTASIDHMDFLVPVRVGDFVILRSSVNRVFTPRWKWASRFGWRIIARKKIGTSAPRI
jgi:acyl-CoA hydrolase